MEEPPMTCDDVVSGELVAKYVVDELEEEARDAFEQHYFECRRCFELLQTYRAMQAELARTRELAATEAPRPSWVWRWSWAPALAVLFIAVSVGLWLRPEVPGSSDAPPPGLPTTIPAGAPLPPIAPPPPPPAPAPSLADLARVDPPVYAANRLRGAGEATARFDEAMKHYQRREWAAAIPGLRAAATLDSEAPHIAFFLGASQLLAGQPGPAIQAFKRTIALGESPYLEDAHFYLAKAHLQTQRIDDAIRELERTVKLGGDREAEARKLLAVLAQRVKSR